MTLNGWEREVNSAENVESQLASDRRTYGASFHRVIGGKKVRIPPWLVVISAEGQYMVSGEPCEVVEQIATGSEVSDG